ncbi:MAG: VCBS repeat-containing protein [Bacteroidota bacterium]|jgi:hypothetical protein|nr:VCBS repeat-containing protein [Cytophagales bacterium]MCE2958127.1 VCBS repeat-containing protein [Flammeovirgaceae bacterium]MCZ8068946.1 VCBS repeat-containing protein [Cytophagales bacterium]
MIRFIKEFFLLLLLTLICFACQDRQHHKFERVPANESGLAFSNTLVETVDFNIFNYMYFYNGAGLAVGDVNGDNLLDVFFTANQSANRLFLNQGNLKFIDITAASAIGENNNGWATGVTMADVNGDGRLDIYVCFVGADPFVKGKNQLLINEGVDDKGIPHFIDKAGEFGLDLKGYSTQAAFFDYDKDGDLDMFMLNHSLHKNGTYGKANSLRQETHPTAGDKLLRNDNGKFVDVTEKSGIYSSALGYGLGVVVSDVNLDGWPDIYVGNDFHENDYLYINQRNGTFSEKLEQSMNHTSRYTMGVDFADFNNDAFPDLIAMDMLPSDYQRLKASAAEDPYDTYKFKKEFGYNEQYTRNVLQINNHNGTFSEIGLFAGVSATDWSWSTLFADFDLDGNKDIFVSNGILRRSNDLDYINFISDPAIQKRMEDKLSEAELQYIQKMPQVKINKFLFLNNGDSTFANRAKEWGLEDVAYSNGAVYADLDNDGDLDLLLNNINDEAFLYVNQTIKQSGNNQTPTFLQVELIGSPPNTRGFGGKVFVYANGKLQMQECMATRGFQSSVDTRLSFGLAQSPSADSLIVVWPDDSYQKLTSVTGNQSIVLKQTNARGKFNYTRFFDTEQMLTQISEQIKPAFVHRENDYIEFDREILMPFMASADGPAASVADFNNDGLDDFFLGGGKWQAGKVFIQNATGFTLSKQPLLDSDSLFEDVASVVFDADNDKDIDLLVVSGGNEFSGKSEYLNPRLYLNNGKGIFEKRSDFPEINTTGSCAALADFDGDGDLDLFLGGRAVPWRYGVQADSYVLINNGDGKFANETSQVAAELNSFGFVNDAIWMDVDNDHDQDLVVASEWRPIEIFENKNGKLSLRKTKGLEGFSGWWNTVTAADFDGDGDLDMLAGNLGLNSKLKASAERPLRMYVNDFDKNGSLETILTSVIDGVEYPFNTRDELTKQMPSLKKKFLSYQKFANAPFKDFFPSQVVQASKIFQATSFESVYIENKGGFEFKLTALPRSVQLSTANAFLVDDFNKDGHLDVLVGGNFFRSNIQMGRYDASHGQLLVGTGNGSFRSMPGSKSGFAVKGEVRHILPLKVGTVSCYAVVRNNDAVEFFTLKRHE